MPNNNYTRGAQFERKVKDYLESQGWFAQRSAGSHGLTDVVAIAPPHGRRRMYFEQSRTITLIQCKTGKAKMSKKDREAFKAQADTFLASAYEITPDSVTLITGYDILDEWFETTSKGDTWLTTPQQ